ncbi:SDR family oxidoreductase [Streptomyces sp. NPDC012637]|uniref:SDR family oxidoreductase n=1 Tax=Streptomyces sp. NPDC012637 TaxID=3364842 RepID=UPI0036E5B196
MSSPDQVRQDHATTGSAIGSSTHGLARMLSGRGIRADAVAPGPVRTPLVPAAIPGPTKSGEQSPSGRPARPAEMAPAYAFPASGQACHVTVEIVDAPGGRTLP